MASVKGKPQQMAGLAASNFTSHPSSYLFPSLIPDRLSPVLTPHSSTAEYIRQDLFLSKPREHWIEFVWGLAYKKKEEKSKDTKKEKNAMIKKILIINNLENVACTHHVPPKGLYCLACSKMCTSKPFF